MATAANRASAPKPKPVSVAPDEEKATDGSSGEGSEGGSDRRGPGRTGEPGCRRCFCTDCLARKYQEGRLLRQLALCILFVFIFVAWNDWDIRQLSKRVGVLT